MIIQLSALYLITFLWTAFAYAPPSGFQNPLPAGTEFNETQWEDLFNWTKQIPGGFNAVRLFSSIDSVTGATSSAFPAAIATQTKLLLGVPLGNYSQEINAIKQVISQRESSFTDLVVGIVVWVMDGSGPSQDSDVVTNINGIRSALSSTSLKGVPLGLAQDALAWQAASSTLLNSLDFVGADIYPAEYDSLNIVNVGTGVQAFKDMLAEMQKIAKSKPLWITGAGWAASGTVANYTSSPADAQTYWNEIGCDLLFNKMPVFWFSLIDVDGGYAGVLDGSAKPKYDLTCSQTPSASTSSASGSDGTSTSSLVGAFPTQTSSFSTSASPSQSTMPSLIASDPTSSSSISPTQTSNTNVPTSTGTDTPSSTSSTSSTTGQVPTSRIIGIAAGVVGLITVVAISVYYCECGRRRATKNPDIEPQIEVTESFERSTFTLPQTPSRTERESLAGNRRGAE